MQLRAYFLLISLLVSTAGNAVGLATVAPLLRIINHSRYDIWLWLGNTKKIYQIVPQKSITVVLESIDNTIELFSQQEKFKTRTIDVTSYKKDMGEHSNEILEITVQTFRFWPRSITYTNPRWVVNERWPERPAHKQGLKKHRYRHHHKRHEQKLVIQNKSGIDIAYTYSHLSRLQILKAEDSIKIPLYIVDNLVVTVAPHNNPNLMMGIDITDYLKDAKKHKHKNLYIEITQPTVANKLLGYTNPVWRTHIRQKKNREENRA